MFGMIISGYLLTFLLVVIVILLAISLFFMKAHENEKEKSKFSGKPLKLGHDYVGKVFIPRALYERKTNIGGGVIHLMEAYKYVASTTESKAFLFEISEKEFEELNKHTLGTKLFIYKAKVVQPGISQFYFEPFESEVKKRSEEFA